MLRITTCTDHSAERAGVFGNLFLHRRAGIIDARSPFLFVILFSVLLSTPALSGSDSLPQNPYDQIYHSNDPIVLGEDRFIMRMQKTADKEQGPLGLVLSGGSARAFAHIGVLRYLEEQDLIPDFIVSNSMGSIVGLLYAAGLSPDQIYTIFSQTDTSKLFSLKFPLDGGLLTTSKMENLLYEYIGDIRIEDLQIPIMIICEDLNEYSRA